MKKEGLYTLLGTLSKSPFRREVTTPLRLPLAQGEGWLPSSSLLSINRGEAGASFRRLGVF